MFKRSQKPVAPKPVEPPAPVFNLECTIPGCEAKVMHALSWTIPNIRAYRFFCEAHWAARQERLKRAGG